MTRQGYVFWDDETANPQQRICQVGYCLTDLEGNPVGEPVCQLVDPESEFSPFNVRVHHITPDAVVGAPNFARFYEERGLDRLLESNCLVAHNAKGADIHHLRKSLAAYGIDMPQIELIDTQEMAVNRGFPARLERLCSTLGIELRGHHNALTDALACRDAFWAMGGGGEAEGYAPRAPNAASLSRRRTFSGLGYVNGSNETVEDALAVLESRGLRGDPFEIETLDGLRVVVSGIVPGYSREGIKAVLVEAGAIVPGSVSGRTQFLAIGDNVGRNKLDKAEELGVRVITVGELLDVLNR